MSERSWFSYRYAVPGYTFILLAFAINLDFVITVIVKAHYLGLDVAAVVGILVFISGPALGFIVSQLYYVFFYWRGYGWFISPTRTLLINKQIIRENKDIHLEISDSDYWFHTNLHTEHQGIFLYLTRRWDLFNSLLSTAASIPLGLLAGYIIRMIFSIDSVLVTIGFLVPHSVIITLFFHIMLPRCYEHKRGPPEHGEVDGGA